MKLPAQRSGAARRKERQAKIRAGKLMRTHRLHVLKVAERPEVNRATTCQCAVPVPWMEGPLLVCGICSKQIMSSEGGP